MTGREAQGILTIFLYQSLLSLERHKAQPDGYALDQDKIFAASKEALA